MVIAQDGGRSKRASSISGLSRECSSLSEMFGMGLNRSVECGDWASVAVSCRTRGQLIRDGNKSNPHETR